MKKLLIVSTILLANITPSFASVASWYGDRFHGRLTANGERFNMHAQTAAHKTLTFGTKIKVTNRRNGKSTIVCINDRGPYIKGRHIDLSKGAARKIGVKSLAKVTLKILHKPKSWRYGRNVCG